MMRRSTWKFAGIVKSFKLNEIVGSISDTDLLFARKLPQGGCQFFAWPGLSHEMCVKGILQMPQHLQTVHAVFGRADTPLDVGVDVDCPIPDTLRTVAAIEAFQKKVLTSHLEALHAAIQREGAIIDTQVCLQSPNLKKASFHVHIKLKDQAFTDVRSLAGFMQNIPRETIPFLDHQIYRPMGMLRMYKSKKENLQSPIGLYLPEFQIGFKDGVVSDEDAALHSLIVRKPGTFTKLITKQCLNASAFAMKNIDHKSGERTKPASTTPLVPRTAIEACENARAWLLDVPPEQMRDFRTWIAVGLNAHRVAYKFQDASIPSFNGKSVSDTFLDAWIQASKKVPEKFEPGACERKWMEFQPENRDDGWWISYRALCNFGTSKS